VYRIFWLATFVLALFICSRPMEQSAFSTGYVWLSRMVPSAWSQDPDITPWFYLAPGAVLFVHAVDNSPALQALFTHRFSRYLGRISFAMYIVHGPILVMWQGPVQDYVWRWTGTGTQIEYGSGVFVTALFIFTLVFWAADVFWRLVDVKSVDFARWVSDQCWVT
jgi:peptidoglycan/LPS O-acetylase OafA/YrhL